MAVPRAILQSVAMTGPKLMMSPKAVAMLLMCTERLEGKTADTIESGSVSMSGGVGVERVAVMKVVPVQVSPADVSIQVSMTVIIVPSPETDPLKVKVPLASKDPLKVLE